jgi:hypothetical protein
MILFWSSRITLWPLNTSAPKARELTVLGAAANTNAMIIPAGITLRLKQILPIMSNLWDGVL